MAEDKIVSAEGWQVDPKEVRDIAARMGFPSSTPMPEVIIVDESQPMLFQGGLQIHKCKTTESPSGFFITVPEKMLKKVTSDAYVLGPAVREDLRHELAHYEDYLGGGHVGRGDDPYATALKEVRAELRTRPRSMSLSLAQHASRLVEEYGLSEEGSLRIMADAARELGVSSHVVSRMYKLSEI